MFEHGGGANLFLASGAMASNLATPLAVVITTCTNDSSRRRMIGNCAEHTACKENTQQPLRAPVQAYNQNRALLKISI